MLQNDLTLEPAKLNTRAAELRTELGTVLAEISAHDDAVARQRALYQQGIPVDSTGPESAAAAAGIVLHIASLRNRSVEIQQELHDIDARASLA